MILKYLLAIIRQAIAAIHKEVIPRLFGWSCSSEKYLFEESSESFLLSIKCNDWNQVKCKKWTCHAFEFATPLIVAIAMTISKGRSTAKKKYESQKHHPEDRHLLLPQCCLRPIYGCSEANLHLCFLVSARSILQIIPPICKQFIARSSSWYQTQLTISDRLPP